jgi:hypothetical protein
MKILDFAIVLMAYYPKPMPQLPPLQSCSSGSRVRFAATTMGGDRPEASFDVETTKRIAYSAAETVTKPLRFRAEDWP